MATEELTKISIKLKEFLGNASNTPFYVAIGIIFLSTLLLLVLFLKKSRGARKNSVIFLGLCDSGKTLLYGLLGEKRKIMTHTSIRENKGKYILGTEEDGKFMNIIDLPGQERIRGQYIKKYEENTRGIIFLIDSATFPKQVRDIAEFLYDVFANKTWRKLKPSILIACNKQDLPTAKSCNVIKSQLEKELNNLRTTRAAALKGTDDSNSPENVDIGKKGKDFTFSNLHSKVDFIECQLKDGDASNLANIEGWMKKLA